MISYVENPTTRENGRVCCVYMFSNYAFQEVAKYRIILYSLNLICDDVLYILLYLRVVPLDFSSHLGLIFGLILEVRNQRDWLIGLFFLGNLVSINDNLGMKNLLLDALPEVVGYGSNNIPCVSVDILLAGIRASS